MKLIFLMPLFVITAGYACSAETCNGTSIDGESSIIAVLATHAPTDQDREARNCITEAIEFSSEVRPQGAVPQLIRYLVFHKDPPPEESQGLILHPPIEGDDYPAVLALARIGAGARPLLLQVICSESTSTLARQNAAHAIVMSFLLEPEHDPGKGILYLRQAEAGGRCWHEKTFGPSHYPCPYHPSMCEISTEVHRGPAPK